MQLDLSAPKVITFSIAVVIALIAAIIHYAHISVPYITPGSRSCWSDFWSWPLATYFADCREGGADSERASAEADAVYPWLKPVRWVLVIPNASASTPSRTPASRRSGRTLRDALDDHSRDAREYGLGLWG